MPHDPIAIARALILALFPALAQSIRQGMPARQAFDAAWTVYGPGWRDQYGPEVGRAAAAALDELMAWNVLEPTGRAYWYGLAPVADPIPPGEGIEPPVEAIGWWARLTGG